MSKISGKTIKNDTSQEKLVKKEVFEKKSGIVTKLKKNLKIF